MSEPVMTVPNDPRPRKALGRGLAALIPNPPASPATAGSSPETGVRELPIETVRPNRKQPRKTFDETALLELTRSITLRGVLQPIIVRRLGNGYEIVAGERRWRAAARAGLQQIPALVKDFTDTGALEVALIENIQRADLDPLEEAEAYHRLIQEHGLTQDRVADAVGKSRSAVSNALRLLKLPDAIITMLAVGKLSAGHARAIMTLDDQTTQIALAEHIVGRQSTVREAEHRARMLKRSATQASPAQAKSAQHLALEERLQRSLATKVRLHERAGKGRIEIHFHDLDQLDALLKRLV